MTDLTKQVLDEYARQQKPSWREAYLNHVMAYTQINSTRTTLEVVERAMRREGIPDEVIRRVLQRAVIGDEQH